jgi:hypothetical protein
MNAPEKLRRFAIPTISPEALVGIGITIAELGVLCLLLGWAEHMRSVPKIAVIWLALGALLAIGGGLIAASARFKKRQRPRADLPPAAAPDASQTVSEPEEQRY